MGCHTPGSLCALCYNFHGVSLGVSSYLSLMSYLLLFWPLFVFTVFLVQFSLVSDSRSLDRRSFPVVHRDNSSSFLSIPFYLLMWYWNFITYRIYVKFISEYISNFLTHMANVKLMKRGKKTLKIDLNFVIPETTNNRRMFQNYKAVFIWNAIGLLVNITTKLSPLKCYSLWQCIKLNRDDR